MIRVGFLSGFLLTTSAIWAQQYIISTVAGGVPPPTPAAATTSSVGDSPRVAVDSSGNFYFGGLHSVLKVDRSGTLTRVAGNGRAGSTGDGGLATNAQLAYPDGIAVDAAGSIFVSDRQAHVIRKIAPNGIISTFAGSPCLGGIISTFGAGSPILEACVVLNPQPFATPTGLALDSSGNLYVADMGGNRVLKFAPDGSYATFAGTGAAGFSGDGGPAVAAALNGPAGVALDASGNLYIADTFNNRIRKVAPGGTIGTVAGTGLSSYSKDGTPAAQAGLFLPTDVAVDASGTLYIADYGNSMIRQVANGLLRTIAGSIQGAPPVDGQEAVSAVFNGPTGLAVDAAGVVYFAEGSIGTGSGLADGDFRVWKVTTDGLLFAAAGNGINNYSGDGGPGALAQFDTPAALALDSSGNLYIADSRNHRVRKLSPNGTVTTAAGTGTPGFTGDGGPATGAQLNHPMGVAVDSANNLYIADSANNRIRRVTPGGTITTIAGNGNAAFFGDGGPATTAALHDPYSVTVDASGVVYVADTLDYRVRKFTPGGNITTVAGDGLQGSAGDGGAATSAQLNFPAGVAVDAAGNVYIADQGAGQIRKVAVNGSIGTLAADSLSAPGSVIADASGTLYVSDSARDLVLKIAAGTTGSTTIAGNRSCCYSGDGGLATSAQLNQPWGLALDPAGNLYVADSGNNAIRVLQPGASTPAISTVANGASNRAGPVAPGETVVIFGSGLGPSQLATSNSGVTVTFSGTPAQVIYASAGQVSAIVPPDSSGPSLQVVVRYLGLASAPFTAALTAASPAIFTQNATGAGQAIAANQDGSLNSATHPAAAGSTITLYATGLGPPLEWFAASPTILSIGGLVAAGLQLSTASPVPAGVVQVTATIPAGVQPGSAVAVSLQAGGAASPAGVTIAVSRN